MTIEAQIAWAKAELERILPGLDWVAPVIRQLDYCADVLAQRADPARLEHLNMGYVVARECEGRIPDIEQVVSEIQYTLRHRYLSYAAKVRLGIHAR